MISKNYCNHRFCLDRKNASTGLAYEEKKRLSDSGKVSIIVIVELYSALSSTV
jgi:hypothetical protein